MRILHLIVARGGSKGVPGKNIRKIGAHSLIGYKAISALKSKSCAHVIISSEAVPLQQEARRYGVDVPFTRPNELATDTASSMDVINHTVEWYEQNGGQKFDAIMLLEPASPFATYAHLDSAVELMKARDAKVVVGVKRAEISSRFIGEMDSDNNIRKIIKKFNSSANVARQNFAPEYTPNGALYLVRWDFFKKYKNFYADENAVYGLEMPMEYSVEIDTPQDLQWAEFLVEKRIVDTKYWE